MVTTHLRAESVHLLEDNSQDRISDYWSSFFAQKNAHVLNRLGRSKHHKVYINFKFHLVPVKSKDLKFRTKFGIELRMKSNY